MKEKLTLNPKEQTRVIVLNRVETKQIGVVQAAVLLDISERQAWRLLSAYRKSGAAGLAHGNQERKPVNLLSDEVKRVVIKLAGEKYNGSQPNITARVADVNRFRPVDKRRTSSRPFT